MGTSSTPLNDGGIELVVSHLTNELVRRAYEVRLFASGNSQTLAKLEDVYHCWWRQDSAQESPHLLGR
jgi:hypothetical protein